MIKSFGEGAISMKEVCLSVLRKRAARHPKRHPESGVTLIEMMVVLVIIALVAAMIVPNVIGRPNEARVAVAKTDIRAIASALELYRLDNRAYPTTSQGLGALVRRPTSPPDLAIQLGARRLSPRRSHRPMGQCLCLSITGNHVEFRSDIAWCRRGNRRHRG